MPAFPFKAISFLKAVRKIRKGEINVSLILGLFIFILIGVVLLPIITSTVSNLTTTSYVTNTTVTTSGTVTETLTNTYTIYPPVTGSTATLLSLVPLFYILVMVVVPAVIAYRLYRE